MYNFIVLPKCIKLLLSDIEGPLMNVTADVDSFQRAHILKSHTNGNDLKIDASRFLARHSALLGCRLGLFGSVPNKVIDIAEWLVFGGTRLERVYSHYLLLGTSGVVCVQLPLESRAICAVPPHRWELVQLTRLWLAICVETIA